MEDLPKLVRDRLAAPAPSDHPDADLLTAFSENALGPRERAEIVRHLAVCSFCREVNSLAQPEEEKAFAVAVGMSAAAPLALARAPRRSFNLRWGALGAVAVIVAAATWSLRPSHKEVSALPPQEVSSAKGDRRLDELQLAQAKEEGSQLSRQKQMAAPKQSPTAGSRFKIVPKTRVGESWPRGRLYKSSRHRVRRPCGGPSVASRRIRQNDGKSANSGGTSTRSAAGSSHHGNCKNGAGWKRSS